MVLDMITEKFISIHENGGSFEEIKGNEEVKDDLIYIYVDGSYGF